MTLERYWSRFKSYLLLTQKIRIDPLIIKQKDTVEKKQEVDKEEDKDNLELALEVFRWVTGQETENQLMKAYLKQRYKIYPYMSTKSSGKRMERR